MLGCPPPEPSCTMLVRCATEPVERDKVTSTGAERGQRRSMPGSRRPGADADADAPDRRPYMATMRVPDG